MHVTYTSPIQIDVVPLSDGYIIFVFKLKGHKNKIKLNVDINIYYKDPYIIGRVFLISAGKQNVFTGQEEKNYSMEFKIPKFQNLVKSNIYIGIEPSNPYDKVVIEDIKIEVKNTAYSHPNNAMAVPSLGPKLGCLIDIKEIVTKGYREILKREPDPIGLESYINQMRRGMNVENFYEMLRSSEEYRCRLKNIEKIKNIIARELIPFKEGQKIAIASIVRNEEHNGNLIRFLDCCKELERYHQNIVYIFLEGDSTDKTYEILKNWTDQRTGSILEKINKGQGPFGKTRETRRTLHLAELRNKLIDIILYRQDVGEVLMIDANYGWKGDLVSALRKTNAHLAAPMVFMNKDSQGRHMFYDIWVFRKNGREFWSLYPYADGMSFDNPIDVDSIGSGYLIKRQVLEAGVRYDGSYDSEQVGFCNNAKNLGFSIKLNPKIYIRKGGYKE
jgi:hypothetical protein